LVEAQHSYSTLKVVDSVDEQKTLEELVEETKPMLPPECRGLHYLLSTPFRYGALYPKGSRFRRAGMTAGVFYGSEAAQTAVAEMTFYRLLFFVESPDTPWPRNPAQYTAFSAAYATERAIDLTSARYSRDRARFAHVTDYRHCQAFADTARAAQIETLRYASVRDPAGGMNLALLTCRAFVEREPRFRITFDRACFAVDPRIAQMRWARGGIRGWQEPWP
jgi:hypothetical protein